jgi:ribosomal protein L7Ae-like RNA K-turn-binding protein
MSNNAALSLLGIARRAGKLQAGFLQCESAIKSGKAALALSCSDISPKTEKELKFLCGKHNVAHISADFTLAELTGAIGVKAGLCAVCDKGFADRLSAMLTVKREG